ncbi:MAG TPA: MFS transporter [Gemmatimonadota bacterium]|nr:MFS transporter [Gemmatimonadota bacterium]
MTGAGAPRRALAAAALWLLAGAPRSRRRATPFDWPGQATSLVGLAAQTLGLIEAGDVGFTSPAVVVSLALAALAVPAFLVLQERGDHPVVPLPLFRSGSAATPVAIGFTFMVGFYGMVFLMSLFLQERRGLSVLAAGLAFLPVTGFSVFIPVVGARLAERLGGWVPITVGQVSMAAGLLGLSAFAHSASVPVLVGLMAPVGFGAGMAMPPATSLLLNTVPEDRSGIASGVLNTSRQVGGALAIAAFGALIAAHGYDGGMQPSLAIAGTLLLLTAAAGARLRGAGH